MRLDLHTMIPHELTLSLQYIYNLILKHTYLLHVLCCLADSSSMKSWLVRRVNIGPRLLINRHD